MKRRTSAFVRFWYDFVIGDDWSVAVGVIAALALTYGLSATAMPVWWVLPAAVALVLPLSLVRVARRAVTDHQTTAAATADNR
jgi:phage shock protein PspC (stress-responsive transcriptional regulator)